MWYHNNEMSCRPDRGETPEAFILRKRPSLKYGCYEFCELRIADGTVQLAN